MPAVQHCFASPTVMPSCAPNASTTPLTLVTAPAALENMLQALKLGSPAQSPMAAGGRFGSPGLMRFSSNASDASAGVVSCRRADPRLWVMLHGVGAWEGEQ